MQQSSKVGATTSGPGKSITGILNKGGLMTSKKKKKKTKGK